MSLASKDECAAVVIASWNISSPTTPRSPDSISDSIVAMARSMAAISSSVRLRGGQARQFHLEGFAGLDDVGDPVGVFAQRLDGALLGGTTYEDGAVTVAAPITRPVLRGPPAPD